MLESRQWPNVRAKIIHYCNLFIYIYFQRILKRGVKVTNQYFSYTAIYSSGEIHVRLTEEEILIFDRSVSILYFLKGHNPHI
jgi:hypothetical protein